MCGGCVGRVRWSSTIEGEECVRSGCQGLFDDVILFWGSGYVWAEVGYVARRDEGVGDEARIVEEKEEEEQEGDWRVDIQVMFASRELKVG